MCSSNSLTQLTSAELKSHLGDGQMKARVVRKKDTLSYKMTAKITLK